MIIKPEFLSQGEIENLATNFRCQVKKHYGLKQDYGFAGEVFLDYLLDTGQISTYDFTDKEGLSEKVLGKYDLVNRRILIYENLKNNKGRENFTIGHEAGHCILHSRLFEKQYSKIEQQSKGQSLSFIDNDESMNGNTIKDKYSNILEKQANLFASFLLMPTDHFSYEFKRIARQVHLDLGVLYLVMNRFTRDIYFSITNHLMSKFKTSREACLFKLIQYGYIIPQKIGSLYITPGEVDINFLEIRQFIKSLTNTTRFAGES